MLTAASAAKLPPRIVTAVPPLEGPEAGVIVLTVGGAEADSMNVAVMLRAWDIVTEHAPEP